MINTVNEIVLKDFYEKLFVVQSFLYFQYIPSLRFSKVDQREETSKWSFSVSGIHPTVQEK